MSRGCPNKTADTLQLSCGADQALLDFLQVFPGTVQAHLETVELQMAVAVQHAAQGLFRPVLGHSGQVLQALLEPALLRRAKQRVAPVAQDRRVQPVCTCLAQLVLPP